MAKAVVQEKPLVEPEPTSPVAAEVDPDFGMDKLTAEMTMAQVEAVLDNPDEKFDAFALAEESTEEPRFLDDPETEEAEGEELAEGEAEAEELAADSEVAEAPAELAAEPDSDVAAKAKAWDDFASSFADDPVGAMRDFMGQLNQEQRNVLLSEVAGQNVDIPADYEPVNEIEQAVFQKRDWLING